MTLSPHQQRVRKELKAAGMSSYGRMKDEARNVANLLHPEEHVKGVAYGRYEGGSAMLIATDRRVLFFDKKPLFQTLDELTYDVLSGIKLTQQTLFSSLILFTRIGNYTLRYVNLKSAIIFRDYLERHLLEHPTRTYEKRNAIVTYSPKPVSLSKSAQQFLIENHVAVLSTIDRNGNVYGATVYYYPESANKVYILTKASTQKANNILAHPQVALTVSDSDRLQTLQIQGMAEVEIELRVRKRVFAEIIKNHKHGQSDKLPLFQIEGDDFIVIKVSLNSFKFSNYGQI